MRRLQDALARARTRPLTPRREPPGWLDDAKLEQGAAFGQKRQSAIFTVHSTSSLAATFAARDVAPVLMQTGKLTREFVPRMFRTGLQTGALARYGSRDAYVAKNYPQAVALGEMHRGVGESVRGALKWPPAERVPMSQQAYALVLATFAWWPVEAQIARKALDPERDRREIDGWLHLWAGLGWGMGLDEPLLPTDFARAQALANGLRSAQYVRRGDAPPDGLPTLLGGQVRMLRLSVDKARAAEVLNEHIQLSPGLADALGLRSDPVAQLERYAALPAPLP